MSGELSPLGLPAQSAYTAYTSTIAGASSDPTLGSGSSASGYYQQQGKRVWGYATITFGASGVAAGSGAYGLLLPVEAVREQPVGTGYLIDASDSYRVLLGAVAVAPAFYALNTRRAIIQIATDAGAGALTGATPVGAAAPWTWAASDIITIQFDYEAA